MVVRKLWSTAKKALSKMLVFGCALGTATIPRIIPTDIDMAIIRVMVTGAIIDLAIATVAGIIGAATAAVGIIVVAIEERAGCAVFIAV